MLRSTKTAPPDPILTRSSANAYLAGPIVAQLGQHPALSDITAKQFDVLEEPSAVTRGPIG